MRDWDFEGLLARTLKTSCLILALFCVALVFRPANPVLAGFAVGIAVGVWGAFFLGKRISSIAGIPVEMAKARVVAGCAVRMTSMFAVLLLSALTGWFNICATAAGLFVVPCLFTFGAAGMLIREARQVPGRPTRHSPGPGQLTKGRAMQGH